MRSYPIPNLSNPSTFLQSIVMLFIFLIFPSILWIMSYSIADISLQEIEKIQDPNVKEAIYKAIQSTYKTSELLQELTIIAFDPSSDIIIKATIATLIGIIIIVYFLLSQSSSKSDITIM